MLDGFGSFSEDCYLVKGLEHWPKRPDLEAMGSSFKETNLSWRHNKETMGSPLLKILKQTLNDYFLILWL